jgi:phosphoribosylformylglycinamidine synthase
MIEAKVYVTLKSGVLDPQGETIKHALHSLGYNEVEGLRQGKFFVLRLQGNDPQQARPQLEQMCQRLLANPVIEDYQFEIREVE